MLLFGEPIREAAPNGIGANLEGRQQSTRHSLSQLSSEKVKYKKTGTFNVSFYPHENITLQKMMIWQFFIIPLMVVQIPVEVEGGRMVIAARGMFREFHSEETYPSNGWMQPYDSKLASTPEFIITSVLPTITANVQIINKKQKTNLKFV